MGPPGDPSKGSQGIRPRVPPPSPRGGLATRFSVRPRAHAVDSASTPPDDHHHHKEERSLQELRALGSMRNPRPPWGTHRSLAFRARPAFIRHW